MKFFERFKQPHRRFSIISWGITAGIVLALGGLAAWKLIPRVDRIPESTPVAPTETSGTAEVSSLTSSVEENRIARRINLVTIIPTDQTTEIVKYTVERGDSLFGIADSYHIEPETLYWANNEVFSGSPDSLRPGDVLVIPPVDGVYYEWQEGDSFETVADAFAVEPEDIINWSGNKIDLTAPQVVVGSYLMVPGGTKDDQPLFIETVTRYSTSVGSACGGGYVGRGYFTWPTPLHSLSGYDWADGGGSHRGIDVSAQEGTPVYAADTGVVTKASAGEYNNGYGNVIMIDHGNGFVTLYAHLSGVYVGVCQSVLGGGTIGAAGNTGNSSGAHLHFEIRLGGSAQNPWYYLP